MPVVVDPASLADYAAFPTEIDRDSLGRVVHLNAADLALVRRRTGALTQFGFAVQLITVRAIGAFLPDPTAVPAAVAAATARQLEILDAAVLAGYRDLPVRWRHTAEIRARYGYRDFTSARLATSANRIRSTRPDTARPACAVRIAVSMPSRRHSPSRTWVPPIGRASVNSRPWDC